MARRGPPCSICANPRRAEIDADRRGYQRVAKELGISPSTLQRHRRHAKDAAPAAVVPPVTWDGAAKLSADVVADALAAPPAVADIVAPAGPVDARAVAIETLGALRRVLAMGLPPGDVPKVANSITTVAKLIAKLDGDLELTHATVVRSKPFREMMALIEATIARFPDAAKALAEAFAEFLK